MKPGDLKDLMIIAAVVAAGVLGYRAYRAASDAASDAFGVLGGWGDSVLGAWDAAGAVLAGGVQAVASVPDRIVTAVHGPVVPVGGSSVQLRHTTDLPEGSSQAAAMYWSLYPNAVFYD